ncbi:MAG: hypothetical protein ACHREM_27280, partial [Polyangiales bacterium]
SATIGTGRDDGYPVIEDDVLIGADTTIMASCVVRADVGEGSIVEAPSPEVHLRVTSSARAVSIDAARSAS